MAELNNSATPIYHKDFISMVEVNGLEVFEKSQIDTYINQLGSILEKSESSELTEKDKEVENLIKSELSSLNTYLVKSDDNVDILKFVRTKQVEWDKDEEGNLMKGISGTYLDTQLNRELDRVGQKYGDLEKSKYFKREGSPGNYKYYYTEEQYKKEKGLKQHEVKITPKDSTFDKVKASFEKLNDVDLKGAINYNYRMWQDAKSDSRFGSVYTQSYQTAYEAAKELAKERKNTSSNEYRITDPKEVLKRTKELNNLKAKRSQFLEDSYAYKKLDKQIKQLESMKITDKDGNTIGWKKYDDED